MKPFRQLSDLSDLLQCESKIEAIEFISSMHSFLDEDCRLNASSSTVESAVDTLIEAERTMSSLKFCLADPQIWQITWKRLIAFYKSFHQLISAERACLLATALTSKARIIVLMLNSAICSEDALKLKKEDTSWCKRVYLNLQSLGFYCQRISATLSYFYTSLAPETVQLSMEILLYLRGVLTNLEKCGLNVDLTELKHKSETYFTKAIRLPPSPLQSAADGDMLVTTTSMLPRLDDSLSSPIQNLDAEHGKFYDAIVGEKYQMCEELNNGTQCCRTMLEYIISAGAISVVCSEIECLFTEQSDDVQGKEKVEQNAPLSSNIHANDCIQPLKQWLLIFYIVTARVLVLHNCIGSDIFVSNSMKRVVVGILNALGNMLKDRTLRSHFGSTMNLLLVRT